MNVAQDYGRNSYSAQYRGEIPLAFNHTSDEDTGKAAASPVPGVLSRPEPEQRVQVAAAIPQPSAVLEQDGETPNAPALRQQQPSRDMLMTPKFPTNGMG